ncbi:MAG: phosphatase PAP2 family protein [Catalinimonas sp.]
MRPNVADTLRTNRWFFVPYALLLLAGGALLLLVPKRELFTFVNGRYSDFGDWLFAYGTFLGDGLFVLLLTLLLLLVHYGRAALVAASFLFSGLLSVVLKNLFNRPRPKLYFADEPDVVRLVEGVSVHGHYSFPSGHTITAFACFAMLALVSRPKSLGILWLLTACGVAYSRMYLAQHFFEDVFVGSMIGTACALLIHHLYERHRAGRGWAWTERSLRRRA